MKTTARIEHFKSVKYLDIEFSGERAEEMEKKWEKIKLAIYNSRKGFEKENKEDIKQKIREIAEIRRQLESSKSCYRFWYNKTERKMKNRISELKAEINDMKEKEKEQLYGYQEEEIVKLEQFLKDNQFSPVQQNCITQKNLEIWTLE